MQLEEIMTSPVETVAPDASLADAARKMLAFEIGLLPWQRSRNHRHCHGPDIQTAPVAKGWIRANRKCRLVDQGRVLVSDRQ